MITTLYDVSPIVWRDCWGRRASARSWSRRRRTCPSCSPPPPSSRRRAQVCNSWEFLRVCVNLASVYRCDTGWQKFSGTQILLTLRWDLCRRARQVETLPGKAATCSEGIVKCFLRVPRLLGCTAAAILPKQARETFRKHIMKPSE